MRRLYAAENSAHRQSPSSSNIRLPGFSPLSGAALSMVALVMIFLRTSSLGFCIEALSGDSCDSASRIWLSSAVILLATPAPSLRPSRYCASSSASSGNDPSISSVETVILACLRGRRDVFGGLRVSGTLLLHRARRLRRTFQSQCARMRLAFGN